VKRRPIILGSEPGDGGRDAFDLAWALAGMIGAPIQAIGARPHWLVPAASLALALDLAADEADAAVVVVGSGDTAAQLLAGGHRPVAVAPLGYAARDASALETITVAHDGSDEAEAALRWAAEISIAGGARLRIVGVLDPTQGPFYGMSGSAVEGRERAAARLCEIGARTPGAEAELLEGDVGKCFAGASETADLLVVGARRPPAVRPTLLAGVPDELIDRASCPVVVVPKPYGFST
jgi:nucleotide-binding universal stress UspA family protein